MGKVMSRFSLFRGCREEDEADAKEGEKEEKKERKQESDKPNIKTINFQDHNQEMSASDIRLEEGKNSVSEISIIKNFDYYFMPIEIEHYKKKYEKEVIKVNPPAKINWNCGEMLGCGAVGKVYYGLNNETGEVMAVKQVALQEINHENMDETIKTLELEIDILSHLNHKNIVRYIGTTRDERYFNIFLEYEAGGSIANLIKKYGEFDETLIRIYTKQILEGLEYLHSHGIIHSDIKGRNVLVDSNGIIKLSDFGASKKIYNNQITNQSKDLKGSPYWMAPEVIKESRYGRFADIWSVGCTVIEMATGHPPWSQYKNQFTALFYIGNCTSPPAYPKNLSQTARDFLSLIFKRKPKDRANVNKLLNHPFITNGDKVDLVASSKKKHAPKINEEEQIKSQVSPQSVKQVLIIDGSLDESDFSTGEQKEKATFNFVSKGKN